ncbi:hypothetical protein QR680_016783 [Steinernema hermaphroditum]|uniref:Uncharacterized protein n=1 Tax=Steinernema hermaphroditum TaxID=289476 RepID=A0AA39HCA5_9BILA|nr:hypothetical protein QR680_016783 [Steinernema hermaphroditum]
MNGLPLVFIESVLNTQKDLLPFLSFDDSSWCFLAERAISTRRRFDVSIYYNSLSKLWKHSIKLEQHGGHFLPVSLDDALAMRGRVRIKNLSFVPVDLQSPEEARIPTDEVLTFLLTLLQVGPHIEELNLSFLIAFLSAPFEYHTFQDRSNFCRNRWPTDS